MSQATIECEPYILTEQTSEPLEELPLESTFPIDPEIGFRASNRAKNERDPDYLTPGQVDYYQKENLIYFLCEFAGKVPYEKMPGIITDSGRLKICNIDVLQTAKNAAKLEGEGSREASELLGWERALQAIAQGANRVDIISPPAIADYMLTFSLHVGEHDPMIGGRPVTQVVSRRDEDMGSLGTSRKIYKYLAANAGVVADFDHFLGPEDFITNPIVHHTEDTDSLARVVASIGVEEGDIHYSEQFVEEIRGVLDPMIQDYLRQVDELSHMDPSHWSYEDKKYGLADHLRTMFSLAKRIGRELRADRRNTDVGPVVREIMRLRTVDLTQYYAYVEAIRQEEGAAITGGTSCPSVNSSWATQQLSAFSEVGMSFNTAIQAFFDVKSENGKTLKCTCPNCQKEVLATIEGGRIICPKCHASAPYKC